MKSKTRILVYAPIGRQPFPGVIWQALHYVEGFRRIGYDVYYIDDTWDCPYDGDTNCVTDDVSYTLRMFASVMGWAGLGDRWAYRYCGLRDRIYGMSVDRYDEVLRTAEVLINVTGSALLHDELLRVPKRLYVETDPVVPQVGVAEGNKELIKHLAAHTHHFSFGENFGSPDCGVPIERFTYLPTRQPVVLDWWKPAGRNIEATRRRFTTIANWKQTHNDLQWRGQSFRWSKHWEFLKFIDLPRRSDQRFELALASLPEEDRQMLLNNGWHIADALALSGDILKYRDYIVQSDAEFTTAKDQNIRLRSGWFSDRSATYLAAGKPVITQDTAFDNILPTGEGLHSFREMGDILRAVEAIKSDYVKESRRATEIAEAYFAAEKVTAEIARRADF